MTIWKQKSEKRKEIEKKKKAADASNTMSTMRLSVQPALIMRKLIACLILHWSITNCDRSRVKYNFKNCNVFFMRSPYVAVRKEEKKFSKLFLQYNC